jgi:hypothetical protein
MLEGYKLQAVVWMFLPHSKLLEVAVGRSAKQLYFLQILTRSDNVTLSELFRRSPSLIWTRCGRLWIWDLCFTIWNAYDKLKINV